VIEWPVPLRASEPRRRRNRAVDEVERIRHRLFERPTQRETRDDRR